MGVTSDVQSLDPGALVELFELDAAAIGGGVHRFHAGTNDLRQSVIWQGETYQPWPIEVRGFDKSGTGQLPRPTMTIANVTGAIGALVRDYNDLIGARVTRRRTFVQYLDAANFPNGNPSASPSDELPVDVFFVDQKTHEDKNFVSFTLAAQFDLAGVKVPRRVMARTCGWQYRGDGCGYTGPPVAKVDDAPTSDPALDRCGKRLTSCSLRFGSTGNAMPFGGFPALGLYQG